MKELVQYLLSIWFWALIWIIIKHFLDKDKEKYFYKALFIKEKYFLQKEKCFILLEKIDEVKNNFIYIQIQSIKANDKKIDKIIKYWKDKDYILNLVTIYLPELSVYTNKYNNVHKQYETIIQIANKLSLNNNELNKDLFKTINEFEKEYFEFLSDLKENIKNYLIESENKITK